MSRLRVSSRVMLVSLHSTVGSVRLERLPAGTISTIAACAFLNQIPSHRQRHVAGGEGTWRSVRRLQEVAAPHRALGRIDVDRVHSRLFGDRERPPIPSRAEVERMAVQGSFCLDWGGIAGEEVLKHRFRNIQSSKSRRPGTHSGSRRTVWLSCCPARMKNLNAINAKPTLQVFFVLAPLPAVPRPIGVQDGVLITEPNLCSSDQRGVGAG